MSLFTDTDGGCLIALDSLQELSKTNKQKLKEKKKQKQ
jgi:hypothetical protein